MVKHAFLKFQLRRTHSTTHLLLLVSRECTHSNEQELSQQVYFLYYAMLIESPDRRDVILKYLESQADAFEVTERTEDFGAGPIERVHKQDFIDYLKTAYEEWIEEGGHPNGVLPGTIPHYKVARLGKLKAANCLAKSGEYCFDMSAVITKGMLFSAFITHSFVFLHSLLCAQVTSKKGMTPFIWYLFFSFFLTRNW